MTKLRKKTFTIVEQAKHEIRGFQKLMLDDKVRYLNAARRCFYDVCNRFSDHTDPSNDT